MAAGGTVAVAVTNARLSPVRRGIAFELATQLATRLDRTNRMLGDLAFVDVTGRVQGSAEVDIAYVK